MTDVVVYVKKEHERETESSAKKKDEQWAGAKRMGGSRGEDAIISKWQQTFGSHLNAPVCSTSSMMEARFIVLFCVLAGKHLLDYTVCGVFFPLFIKFTCL